MSSSKLPQTGIVISSPFILSGQFIGVIALAAVSALLIYKLIEKSK